VEVSTNCCDAFWVSLAPRVAVSYFPAAGAKTGMGRTLENWNDVARWMGEMEETQVLVLF